VNLKNVYTGKGTIGTDSGGTWRYCSTANSNTAVPCNTAA